MWAYATPPGGMVATFIDNCFAPTFSADMPILYVIPFQSRQVSLARMTVIPSLPSVLDFRFSAILDIVAPFRWSRRENYEDGMARTRRPSQLARTTDHTPLLTDYLSRCPR